MQELHDANLQRRPAEEALQSFMASKLTEFKLPLSTIDDSAPPHGNSSGPSGGSVVVVPPSAQDLHALYCLCGGDEARVTATLARMWGTQPQMIASSVSGAAGGGGGPGSKASHATSDLR